MSIIIKDLRYIYNEGTPLAVTALAGVSLEIAAGECVGIIGSTGSGKSTLVQHLNGLLLPTHGSVLIDGINLADRKSNRKKIRQKVGLVFQYPEYQLFEETIFEDIAFGPRNMGCDEQEIARRVSAAMEVVSLPYDHFKHRSPFELSGGQMRRVAIAGIIAMHPKVLVLDEPTAGLDPRSRSELLAEIMNMRRELGLTVILVSHSMEEVAQVVERVIVLEAGKIVLAGPVREVFKQAELLKSIGLGIPQATEMMLRLRQRGADVPTEILTVEEANAAILAWQRSKRRV
ncbi:MAG: energy-coupling factor transporter ATPase [bacterium]|jgi:energy-coupling factor transport system ATP-binding protein